jgi:hypothetical protein
VGRSILLAQPQTALLLLLVVKLLVRMLLQLLLHCSLHLLMLRMLQGRLCWWLPLLLLLLLLLLLMWRQAPGQWVLR